RPERRQGRGTAHRNGAEPATARKATMPSPAGDGCLPHVTAESRSAFAAAVLRRKGGTSPPPKRPRSPTGKKITVFCNTIRRKRTWSRLRPRTDPTLMTLHGQDPLRTFGFHGDNAMAARHLSLV